MRYKSVRLNFRNLKANGVRVAFYHLHRRGERMGCPVATVAVGIWGNRISRGVALCARDEISEKGFVEKEGRDLALRRMLRAFNRKASGDRIKSTRAWRLVNSLEGDLDLSLMLKSCYDTHLFPMERDLFASRSEAQQLSMASLSNPHRDCDSISQIWDGIVDVLTATTLPTGPRDQAGMEEG